MAGKIIIVKTLLLPKITHILSSLPNPSDDTIKDISKILYSFIWNSKRDPIKRVRLCQTLRDNGLAMIDIESYIKSLKIKWIKRLLKGIKSTWCLLVPSNISTKFVWNFGVEALQNLRIKIMNPFWRDVVSAWTSFTKDFSLPEEFICNENLFNSDITKFKNIRYDSWERNGVKFVGDLLENGRLITWQRFMEKYNIYCIKFEYDNLLRSLPNVVKNAQVTQLYQQPPLPARLQCLLSNTTFSRFFVKTSMNNRERNQNDVIRIKNKWIRDIESFEPLSVLNVKKSVSASRYTSFQFKLVMRILTTNTFLKIIRVQENDMCTFCQESRETLMHLFLTCSCVDKLWNEIERYLIEYGMGRLNKSKKIFGDGNNELITHIVTITKYVIYDARRRSMRPCFNHVKASLVRDFITERYVAKKNENMEKFKKKWINLWTEMISISNSSQRGAES